MADVADSMEGDVIILSISTDTVTPAYLAVVCSINNGLSGQRDVTTLSTKCGTAKSGGSPNWTVTGSLAANTDPGVSEMSHEELIALFQSGDNFLWKLAHSTTPANYFRQGTGFFSNYNETANDGETVQADFTIEVVGDVDATTP